MARVLIKDVSKVYSGNIHAVNKVNIEVKDQEFLVLVGPSGCGKSTILRMIAGLEEITEGEIDIGERCVNNIAPKDRDIAMVFQNYALYPHMTVYKNMAFGLRNRRFPASEIDRRVRQAVQILGIEELLDRKPKALSGGQRQRVAVGRAIVRQPQVFLFDEPLSNLDAKLRVQMRAEISKLHSRLKATMIYVTHDQVEAMTMGDRIVVLLDGKVQQVADPITLYDKPVNKFVAGFIGSPPMNFFEGSVEGENGALVFKCDGVSLSLSDRIAKLLESHRGRKIIFGIRPENVMISDPNGRLKEGAQVQAKVEVVEPMGAESYLHLLVGGTSCVARVESRVRASYDQEIPVLFDMGKSHFFNPETGLAIPLD